MKCFFAVLIALLALPMATANAALDVRVMTFNIRYGTADDGENRWEQRRPLVFELLRQEACDIVGLQEALRSQLDEILAAEPEYKAVGVGRDDGKDAGEFAAILYRHEKFEMMENGTFWLSDTPETAGSKTWGNQSARICTWARLRSKKSWESFYVFNTHLDHRSQRSRFHGVELITERMKSHTRREPIVFMGDFNGPESSDSLRFLRGEIPGPSVPRTLEEGLIDSFRAVHPEAKRVGTFNGFVGDRKGFKIDYILVAPRTAFVIDAYILDWNKGLRYPSDHFPVTARLLLGSRRFD